MAKQEQQGSAAIKERITLREPDMYDVVLLNDDFTTMDFVVLILTDVFYHSTDEAEEIMLAVHNKGEGIAGTYTYDIAQSKAAIATSMAREEGFPLRLKLQKHTD